MTARTFRNPSTVHHTVSGRELIHTVDAKKRMGAPIVWQIWVKLIHNRDENGRLKRYVTNQWLATKLDRPVRTIKRALARLRKAHIVEHEAQTWVARYTVGNVTRLKKVPYRRVYGDWRDGQVVFPKIQMGGLMRLSKKGGRRAGAGRPKGNSADQLVEEMVYSITDIIEDLGNGFECDNQSGPETNQSGPQGKESKCHPDHSQKIEIFSFREETPEAGSTAALANLPSPGRPGNSISSTTPTVVEPPVLPPYPSAKTCELAVTPNPPLFKADTSDEDCVYSMLKYYRGAATAKTGKDNVAYLKGDVTSFRDYPLFAEAAHMLRELEISPAAWVGWAIDFWREYVAKGKKSIPSAKWVFNAKFIYERRGFFKRTSNVYTGGHVSFPACWYDVSRRFNGMIRQMEWEGANTREAEARIVELWFPGGWDRFYDQVKFEAQKDHVRMHRMLQRGEWLW